MLRVQLSTQLLLYCIRSGLTMITSNLQKRVHFYEDVCVTIAGLLLCSLHGLCRCHNRCHLLCSQAGKE